MMPAESVGLPLPHIAFVGIVTIVSVLIVCSVLHIATITMSVIAVLVWQPVVEELHGSLLPVAYPLILTQSSIMPVKYDCTCKVLQISVQHAIHVQYMMHVSTHMNIIYSACTDKCM